MMTKEDLEASKENATTEIPPVPNGLSALESASAAAGKAIVSEKICGVEACTAALAALVGLTTMAKEAGRWPSAAALSVIADFIAETTDKPIAGKLKAIFQREFGNGQKG